MSELTQGPVSATSGQAPVAPAGPAGQAQHAPDIVPSGQAEGQGDTGQGQAQAQAPQPSESTFFDPSSLPPELMPAYKQMQSAFTKKSQEIAKHRDKVAAYDAFMADPITNLQRAAAQYGYQLSRGQAQAAMEQQGAQTQEFQPKNWDDVTGHIAQQVLGQITQQLQPLIQNVQGMHAKTVESSVEQQLNQIDPNWKIYEDEMRDNLRAHPSLVGDVAKLYRLSVPEEVLASKHTQAALKKLEGTVAAAKVEGKGTTPRTAPAPKKVSSFDDAVVEAKRQLAEKG